jgi:hypothetical protein
MNRRNFLAKLGLGALAIPLAAKAEPKISQSSLDTARREGAEQATKHLSDLMGKVVAGMEEGIRRGEEHRSLTFENRLRAVRKMDEMVADTRPKSRYSHNTPNPPKFKEPPELAPYVKEVLARLEAELEVEMSAIPIKRGSRRKQFGKGMA